MFQKLNYNDFKNICINKKRLYVQYEESIQDSDRYYKIYTVDEFIQYECEIDTIYNYEDVIDFETNYKELSNERINNIESITGWTKVRSRKVSGDIAGTYIYFKTGDNTSLDSDGDDDYSITVESGKTIIDFNPDYDYEISGGRIQIHESYDNMLNKECKVAFIMAPYIPVEYGGNYKFLKNKKFCQHSMLYEKEVDPKLMRYDSEWFSHIIRVEVTHAIDVEINIELYLDIYKV